MSAETLLPWATTVMGASIMWFAAHRRTRRLAWTLGVLNQVLWCSYAVIVGAHGFVAGSMLYGAVYIRNLVQGDHRAN